MASHYSATPECVADRFALFVTADGPGPSWITGLCFTGSQSVNSTQPDISECGHFILV
jgi:hypothetical protein